SNQSLSSKCRLPQLMRENRDRSCQAARFERNLLLIEEPSVRRLNAECVEEMGINGDGPDAQRPITCEEIDFARGVHIGAGRVRSDFLEGLIHSSKLEIFEYRDRVFGSARCRKLRSQMHQLLGL